MDVYLIPCNLVWRILGASHWTYKLKKALLGVNMSGLQTIIVEIEAHLNNKPLTYISSDPEPLTPSHLLYGRIIDTLPHSTTTEDENLIIDEDFQEIGSKLHNTLSKKARTQAVIIQ